MKKTPGFLGTKKAVAAVSSSQQEPDETLDALFDGKVAILQSREGYRFSLDAVLLAHFMLVQGQEKIVDLGTGNGVIPLILAALYPSVEVTGLEIQRTMVERAVRNVRLNSFEQRIQIVTGDVCSIKEILPPRIFDLAVSNPPYRGARSGRISPQGEKRVARHEIKGSIPDFVRAGSYLLKSRGRISFIYSAARTPDLLLALRRQGLEPKRLRLVHSFPDAEAGLVLVEGVKGGKSELKILPPLFVYKKGKEYTEEVNDMLTGRGKLLR